MLAALIIVSILSCQVHCRSKNLGLSRVKPPPNRKLNEEPNDSDQPPPRLWPNGIVYYTIDESLSSHRRMIHRALQHIESRSCVRFRDRTSQRDYIEFNYGEGCWSMIGKTGGLQELSLGHGCHDIGTVMHEVLHALGFHHEHKRFDRDKYVSINWQNIKDGEAYNFEKVARSQMRVYNEFDYNSIMIYGGKAFTKNGKNTIIPKAMGKSIVEAHWKNRLSARDVQKLDVMYKCNSKKDF